MKKYYVIVNMLEDEIISDSIFITVKEAQDWLITDDYEESDDIVIMACEPIRKLKVQMQWLDYNGKES